MPFRNDRLRKLREQLGWSQTEAAHKLGWQTYHRFSHIERGTVLPSVNDLGAIADALDTNPLYLLGLIDYPEKLPPELYAIAEAVNRGDTAAILAALEPRLREQARKKLFARRAVAKHKPLKGK